MSTLADPDRLTGVAVIRERLKENLQVVAVLRTMLDHERRLLRIDASNDPGRPGRRKLPPPR
jgi:hypothetical protein